MAKRKRSWMTTFGGLNSQPEWEALYTTDEERVEVDKTGVYPPEMEVAQDLEDGDDDGGHFEVFRFSLDRLKEVKGYLVSERYQADWPHAASQYQEWFVKSLPEVARSMGTTATKLRAAFCSKDAKDRAWAYSSVGGHHGFVNLDNYPLTLTTEELDKRWGR